MRRPSVTFLSIICTALLCFTLTNLAVPSTAAASLKSRLNSLLRHPREVLPEVREQLQQMHVVGSTGFTGSVQPGYYSDMGKFLVSKGEASQFTRLYPPSTASIRKNAERVATSMVTAFDDGGGKPLFDFNHSKAGPEKAAGLLANIWLIKSGIVARCVIIESPMSGAALGDYAQRWGQTALDSPIRLLPLPATMSQSAQAKVRRWLRLIAAPLLDGWLSLHSDDISSLLNELIDGLSAEDLELVSSRIFYVRTKQKPAALTPTLRLPGLLLQTLEGDNDGLVVTEQQKLDGLGTDLGVIEGGHTDFLIRNVLVPSMVPVSQIYAVTQAIVEEVLTQSPLTKEELHPRRPNALIKRYIDPNIPPFKSDTHFFKDPCEIF